MATYTVLVLQCSRLPCTGELNPDVVLCVSDAALIATGLDTIDGTIVATSSVRGCSGCCGGSGGSAWRYSVTYDSSVLVDPLTPLTAAQIVGIFCKDCLTNWVVNQVIGVAGVSVVDNGDGTYSVTVNGVPVGVPIVVATNP